MLQKCELSPEAREARVEYYRSWRVEHPENIRATQLRYWEKKAQEFYGKNYVAPAPGEEISSQAIEMRRAYYANRRKQDPEAEKKNLYDFWERKAREA